MGGLIGGGSQPQSQTVYNSQLPEYARPYFEDVMDRAQDESNEDYQPYTGQRIAGMGDDTSSGLDAMTGYASSPTNYRALMGDTGAYAGQATQVGNQFSRYNLGPGYNNTDYGRYTNRYDGRNIGLDGGDVTGDFDRDAARQYMSPYMDEVVNRAQRGMQEEYQSASNLRNADAAAAGAFGGSRAAVRQQLAERDYLNRALDYEAQARQSAFENAQGQFERDRAARMGLAARNQENRMWEQTQEDQSRQFAAQHGLDREQVRQAALTGRLGAIDMAGTMADRSAQLQQLWDRSEIDRANALLGVGQTREAYQQDALDQAYRDFVNQRDHERNQIAFMLGSLRGVPVNVNQDIMNYQRSNPALGLLGGLGSLSSLQGLGGAS